MNDGLGYYQEVANMKFSPKLSSDPCFEKFKQMQIEANLGISDVNKIIEKINTFVAKAYFK